MTSASSPLRTRLAVAAVLCLATRAPAAPNSAPSTQHSALPETVRVAAIGLNDSDLWTRLAARCEEQSHIHVDTVVSGNKDTAPDVFKQGDIDLITIQAPD